MSKKRKKRRPPPDPDTRHVNMLRSMVVARSMIAAKVKKKDPTKDYRVVRITREGELHLALLACGLGRKVDDAADDPQKVEIDITHVQMWLGENGWR